MAGTLLNRMLFTCRHQFSWPRRADDGGYYQVCLHCGLEYAYDWSAMRRIAPRNGNGGDNGTSQEGERATTPGKRPPGKCLRKSWQPRERRLRLNTPVQFRHNGRSDWQHGVAQNISRSGLLFHSDQPEPQGVALEMIFSMPAEICGELDSYVLCHGTVVRAEQAKPPQMGYFIAVAITGYELLPKDKAAGI